MFAPSRMCGETNHLLSAAAATDSDQSSRELSSRTRPELGGTRTPGPGPLPMSCCWFCHPGLSSLRSGTHLFDLNSNASRWCSICVACDSRSTIYTLLSVGGTTSKHIVALIRSGLHTHFDVYHPRHECTPTLQRPSKGRNEHSCRSAGLRPHQHGQISY